jgi:hypothetical protein
VQTRDVSITFSPLHLFLPVAELTLELRAGDFLGVALIGGYGKVPVETSLGDTVRFTAYEVGGQVVVYPLQPFKSLQLGVEAIYLRVESDESTSGGVTGIGIGFAVGPLVGYKLITSGGFTFFVQGGFEYIAVRGEAEDSSSGQSASDEDSRVIPLLNLNLGWSF